MEPIHKPSHNGLFSKESWLGQAWLYSWPGSLKYRVWAQPRLCVPHGGNNLRSYSSETVISLASVERCYCDSATPSPSPLATAFFISPGVRAALLPESYFLWSRSHSVWLVIVEGWSCVVTNSSRWWNVTRNSCVTLRDNAGPGQCWNKLFSELNQGCKIFALLF